MENPRHLSGSRIRPGTVIERSQIKFVIFKMQEDVNGVLARMINTSACKQPSNVSTLRCKMNRWKAPLIANIPWAQSPFLPRRAVITAAVPSLSAGQSLQQEQGSAPMSPGRVMPGLWETFSWGSVSHGCRGEQGVLSTSGPHPGPGFGAVVKYKIPALAGLPSPFMAWLGQGNAGQVPTSLL